ncbi:MAG: hypothetical protein AB8G17_17125 [Gammaproteobacteria bacterium]
MNKSTLRGSSITEFLIIMAFFVPVMFAMPLIAKYGDIKSKTIEASRYAAWERTVWSGSGNNRQAASSSRNDGDREAVKSKNDLRKEIDHRFFGNPVQGLHDDTPSINFMWRHRGDKFMLNGDVSENPQRTPRRAALDLQHQTGTSVLRGAAQVPSRVVDAVAFAVDPNDSSWSGVSGAGGSSVFDSISNSELGSFISNSIQCNPVGVDLVDGLNLGANGFSTATVTTLTKDYMNGDQPVRMAMVAKSAVLGNAWAAPDEDMFSERVDAMALGDMAGCVTLIGDALGTLTSVGLGSFLFGEGMDANPVEDFNSRRSSNSRVLPNYLRK